MSKKKSVIIENKYVLYSDGTIERIPYSFIRKDGIVVHMPLKKIATFKDKDGYLHVSLIINNKQKTYKVHRLVAKYFLPPFKENMCINHKDGNKENNKVSNLEWCSYSENNFHAYKTHLKSRGVFSTKKRPVECSNENITLKFNSIAEACRNLNATSGRIVNAIKYNKKYKGWFWKYV